jgi:hypothetical protein
VFAEPARRHLLFAFIGRDRTLSEVARESGASLSLLHYHVRRFVSLGLLRETGEERRAGRPMKRYTAAADQFTVAGELLDGGPGFGLRRELSLALERRDAAADASWTFYRDERGGMRMRRDTRSKGPVEFWRLLSLDEATLGELAAELEVLLTSYAQRITKRGGKSHLVHAVAVPWDSGFAAVAEGPLAGR